MAKPNELFLYWQSKINRIIEHLKENVSIPVYVNQYPSLKDPYIVLELEAPLIHKQQNKVEGNAIIIVPFFEKAPQSDHFDDENPSYKVYELGTITIDYLQSISDIQISIQDSNIQFTENNINIVYEISFKED